MRDARLLAAAHEAISCQQAALQLRIDGTLAFVADDADCPDIMRLAALAEELGEVARAIHEDDLDALALELSHLTGVALAWSAFLASGVE